MWSHHLYDHVGGVQLGGVSQGVATHHYVLTIPHPRQLLDDRECTLEKCGITMDTRLVLEEFHGTIYNSGLH